MISLQDQLGRTAHLNAPPKRIISLCPSTTETLIALAGAQHVVGRTKYCMRPHAVVSTLPDVGGTKTLDLETIYALQPDLLIAVREENDQAQIDTLAGHYPLLILDPVDIPTMLEGIDLMGQALGEAARAADLRRDLQKVLDSLPDMGGKRALYLIWRKPYMAAGVGTYIDAVMRALGLQNAASHLKDRYPDLEAAGNSLQNVDIVLAASEPYPFKEKHLAEIEARFPAAKVMLADGEAFAWHGVRLLDSMPEFQRIARSLAGDS